MGHSKHYVCSKKYLKAEGGISRLVWMPKRLKEELRERINEQGRALGVDNLADKVADETIGITQEDILSFLRKAGHPALAMKAMV
jgi:acetyl-CoA synthase